MEDIRYLIREILEESYLLHLATKDDGGLWVASVIYVASRDFTLYWKSRIDARHSQAFIHHHYIAGTISPCFDAFSLQKGLQIYGAVQKIEGEIPLAECYQNKRRKEYPHVLKEGQSWYSLQPSLIELTYEKYFAFEKKRLVF